MPKRHTADRLRSFFKDHGLTGVTFHRLLVKAGGLQLSNPDEGRSKVSQWLNGRRGMSEAYQTAYEVVVLQFLDLKLKELTARGAGSAAILSVLNQYGYYLGEEHVFSTLFKVFLGMAEKQELANIIASELKGRLRVELPPGVGRTLGTSEGV